MLVLSGPPAHLQGSAAVEQLQRALQNLARATRQPAIDPRQITGFVDDMTVTNVDAALSFMTSKELPSFIYLALQGALQSGSLAYAKQIIEQYASQLTIAANKVSMQRIAKTVIIRDPMQLQGSLGAFFEGWYKKPWGILLIALGAFGVYKIFIAKEH